ncbi:MAG: apolipoprotein N-acyltransferase [Planctomycetes bacterium]|nr:apolipoprotein N-acyltransferase [Planctomycetota bacterium]
MPACAAAGGLMLYLSFPPADLGPLAFLALVPFLMSVRMARSYRGALLAGLVAATVAYVPAFAWVASVAPGGWLALSFYVGLYVIVAAPVIRFFQRRCPAFWPALTAMLWTGLEFLRMRLGPGFPWLFVGYTQYRFVDLLQMAAWGGVFALTFIVVLFNASLAAMLSPSITASGKVPRRSWALFAGTLALLTLATAAGSTMRGRVRLEEGPVVGVVQQNFPRLVEEIFRAPQPGEDIYAPGEAEIRKAVSLSESLEGKGPSLIVWPETTVQLPLNLSPNLLQSARERSILMQVRQDFRELGRRMGCHLLVGAPTYFPRSAGYVESVKYGATVKNFGNSALMFSPEGEFEGRYDKMKLVPFGEYIPLRDALPFLQVFTPMTRELTPGDRPVVFTLPGEGEEVGLGPLICYEDVFPSLTRAFRRKGADVLVNLTDEGWYRIPGELGQHLAMAVFRAVETRTSVVRAANTGISCFIGPRGEIYARLKPHHEGALAAHVRLCKASTPYVRHGDVFAIACLVLSLAALGTLAALRRRSV